MTDYRLFAISVLNLKQKIQLHGLLNPQKHELKQRETLSYLQCAQKLGEETKLRANQPVLCCRRNCCKSNHSSLSFFSRILQIKSRFIKVPVLQGVITAQGNSQLLYFVQLLSCREGLKSTQTPNVISHPPCKGPYFTPAAKTGTLNSSSVHSICVTEDNWRLL